MAKANETAVDREKRWQAEEDARILASYEEIMSDAKRVKNAIKIATQQANDLQKRVNVMKKIANKGKD